MPIGAFISSKKIMTTLSENPILGHISTFGGHPVSCASSLATVNTILDDNLLEDSDKKGKLICELLDHKLIVAKHQIGLMIAIEFESFEVLKPIIDKAIELGVLTDWFLFNDHSMRIAPPLIITKEEIKKGAKGHAPKPNYDTYKPGSYHDYDVGGDNPPVYIGSNNEKKNTR